MKMSRRSFLKFLCATPAIVVAAKVEQIVPTLAELAPVNPDTTSYVASEAGYGNFYFQFSGGVTLRTSEVRIRVPEDRHLDDLVLAPLGAGQLRIRSREPARVQITVEGTVRELSILRTLQDRQWDFGGMAKVSDTVKVFYEDFNRATPLEQLADMYHTYIEEISPCNLEGGSSSVGITLVVGQVKVFQG